MLTTGSTVDLRRHNRDAVLRAIKVCGSISRTDIAERVGLTNAAISRITKELIDAGFIEEGKRVAQKGQAGRRQVMLRISEAGAYVLGVAVTLNARAIVIANGRGDVVVRTDCSDISLTSPEPALAEFARRAKLLVRQAGIDRRRLLGGAASVAGRVDPDSGRIIGADPLDWDGQRVAATLGKLIGLPFVSEGRAAALLQLEHSREQASGLNDILLINVGLKLGSALMIDGNLLRGATNEAMLLYRYQLKPNVTLDEAASGFAVLRRLSAAGRPMSRNVDPGSYLRRIADDNTSLDAVTRKAFRQSGEALGLAIRQLAPILSLQRIILAGLVVRKKAYLDGVRAKLKDGGPSIEVSRSTTTQSAIHLALDHHLFNQEFDLRQTIAA